MNTFKELRDGGGGGDGGGDNYGDRQNEQRLLGKNNDATSDEAQIGDVQLLNFELSNLRGGGPNLLSGANLILSRRRRYGLMGWNGWGKTTFLTALSQSTQNRLR